MDEAEGKGSTGGAKVGAGWLQANPDLETLRPLAATALEKGLAFVEQQGNDFARLRAHILLEATPQSEGLSALAARQAADGSFPELGQVLASSVDHELSRGGQPGDLVGTLEALWVLSDWKALHVPFLNAAAEYLARHQGADGAWGKPTGGQPSAVSRILLSGLVAGFLGRSPLTRPEILSAAGGYLSQLWSVETIRRGGWPLVAAFALYYTNVHDEGGEAALPWVGRELERGLVEGDYGAGSVLRLLLHCDAATLPGATFEPDGLLATLLEEQGEDGGFDPHVLQDSQRVGPTLDAMLAILQLCRRSNQ
jgi:hypothetical protein